MAEYVIKIKNSRAEWARAYSKLVGESSMRSELPIGSIGELIKKDRLFGILGYVHVRGRDFEVNSDPQAWAPLNKPDFTDDEFLNSLSRDEEVKQHPIKPPTEKA